MTASGIEAQAEMPRGAGVRTRGQDAALEAALAVVRTGRSHALLLVGPAGVGKTTLALDVAAMLLCTSDADARPCGACRGCRMVVSGNHPDLHRLAPEGPGGQVRIGSRGDPEPGSVRRLAADLALLPVEGGARVAIIERADRMNEDAQSALLKTLEEPPAGVVLLLCADEEERLLRTVRSRCTRIRLGPLATRAIETLLGDLGAVDPPTAARLGRLAGGRPGAALAWGAAPAGVVARGEIARTLLDLAFAGPAARLKAVRGLLATAAEIAAALESPRSGSAVGRRRRTEPDASGPSGAGGGEPGEEPSEPETARRAPAAERRRAALLLVDIWRTVARDLAVMQLGEAGLVRDPALIDDLAQTAAALPSGAAAATFLSRLDRAGELLESNVSPELVVDGLALAWPGPPGAR